MKVNILKATRAKNEKGVPQSYAADHDKAVDLPEGEAKKLIAAGKAVAADGKKSRGPLDRDNG